MNYIYLFFFIYNIYANLEAQKRKFRNIKLHGP